MVLNKNLTTAIYIDLYPKCDLISEVYVQVFGEYPGLNALCISANECFIRSSTTTTLSISNTSHLRYYQFNVYVLLFSYNLFVFATKYP